MNDNIVRDKFPAYLKSTGQAPDYYRVLDAEAYDFLIKKLSEKVTLLKNEKANKNKIVPALILADVFEVSFALAAKLGIPPEALGELAGEERAEKGGYEENWIMRNLPEMKRDEK